VTLLEIAWKVEGSEKMRITTGWVEYGFAIAWTQKKGVSDDHDGGRLRKWSREDSLKTRENGQELGCPQNWDS